MNKLFFTLLSALLFSASLYAISEFTQDVNRIPGSSQAYIKQMFPNTSIAGIKIEKEFASVKEYEVMLKDGTEIEFNPAGEWKSIENKAAGLTLSILKKSVSDYLAANYAGKKMVKIEKKLYGIELKLENGLELKFDEDGKFLGTDS